MGSSSLEPLNLDASCNDEASKFVLLILAGLSSLVLVPKILCPRFYICNSILFCLSYRTYLYVYNLFFQRKPLRMCKNC